MKFFVNGIFSATAKANKASLSFVDVEGLPKENVSFSIFVPKSVELKAGEINDLPHWITKNIWSNQYVWKELVKQVKALYHKRIEKAEAIIHLESTLKDFSEKDVEEPIEETGEFVGKCGDTIYGPFKVVKVLTDGSTTYTGIWKQHESNVTGHYYWGHPTSDWVLWELTDKEGHCFILKCSNDYMNDQIGKIQEKDCFFQMKAMITQHNIFRGVRQTKLSARKQDITFFEEE